jgi:hypothetical protein
MDSQSKIGVLATQTRPVKIRSGARSSKPETDTAVGSSSAQMRLCVLALLVLALVASACENEGRSDEARELVVRYLAALAGGSDDHGWSLLDAETRERLDPDVYEALAQAADDVQVVPKAIELLYEDDGAYQFSVTFAEPIPAGYAAFFAQVNEFGNRFACVSEPNIVELYVGIDPISGPAVVGSSCG